MSFRKNTALQNAQAEALGDLFNSGKIQIRSGSQPADPNSVASGTLLIEINLPADAFSVSSGILSKLGTWSGVATDAGVAGHARFISADTLKTFDCSVGESATDLIIENEDINENGIVTVVSFTLSIPSGV